MRFQSQNVAFKFLPRSVDGPQSYKKKALTVVKAKECPVSKQHKSTYVLQIRKTKPRYQTD